MVKLMLKTFVVSIVFFGVGFTFYFFTKGWDGLTATNGDTLTVDKWNSLVTKLDSIDSQVVNLSGQVSNILTQNSAIFSGNQLDLIYCHMSWTATNTVSTRITKTFTAANCGGKLPDSNYLPIIKNIRPGGGLTTFEVLRPGQSGYPGVSWRQSSSSNDGTASAYYLKVK